MEVCHQAQESSGKLQFFGHLVRSLHKHFSKKDYFFTGGEGGLVVILGSYEILFCCVDTVQLWTPVISRVRDLVYKIWALLN